MPTAVKMPQFGESVVEGTVARWLKAVGDPVEKLEPLLDVSTDKIDSEVPAPASGILLQILVEEGQTVDAGTIIAYIGAPGEAVPLADSPVSSSGQPMVSAPSSPMVQGESSVDLPASSVVISRPAGREFVSPVVARMAAQHEIDLDQVPGSGMGGRVTRKDIVGYLENRDQTEAEDLQIRRRSADPEGQSSLLPLSAMRRAIATHMAQSKQTSPHVTTLFEVDMGRVVVHREAHKAELARKGIRLTFTPYFVAAAAQALKAVPEANGRFTDQGILLNHRVHIGVAVALEQGLIVPVIRDADERNLQGLARAINDLADRARQGQLIPEELQGGTFTITNHGVGGSLAGTPIINQPQSAILGIGAIVKRPVVRSGGPSLLPSADDAIVIRPMCFLSLSFDHRILDGAGADRFLTKVKAALENWQ